MSITASSGQQAPSPVIAGSRTLLLPNPALANGGNVTGTANIASDKFTVQLVPSGTLTNDAVFVLKGQVNGSSFFPLFYPNTTTPISFTGTQINAGVLVTIDCKVLQVQGVLTPGTTTGSNGVSMRILD